MKEIFLILPLLFKSGFRKRKGEKGNPILPHIIIGAIMLFYSINGGLEMIPSFAQLSNSGMLGGFIASLVVMSTLVSTLFSIAPMIGMLFYAKDGEFFLQLPIKPSSVYLAKLIYLYLTQLYISAAASLPIIIIIGASQGFGVLFYVISVVTVLFAPFAGLVITSVIATPIVAFSRLLKNRGAVSSVALILVYAIVIIAYLAIALSAGEMQTADIVTHLMPTIKIIADIAVPFLALANASLLSNKTVFGTIDSTAGAFFINIAIATAFFALVILIAVFVGKFFYNKGVSSLLENSKITQKGDNVLKKNKQFASFLKLEVKTVMRNTSLMFSAVGMMVLCPIFAVVIALTMGGDFLGYITYGMVYGETLVLGVTLNVCACIMFSKDGESFYMLKYLPVNKKTVIGAKLFVCWLIPTVFISISLIITLIILQSPWYNWFSLLTVPLLCLGMSAMDMLWDLRHPNLHWTSVSELTKNSSNVLVPTIIGMGIMFLIIIPIVSFLVYYGDVGYLFAYLFTLSVGIILSAVFLPLLYKNGEKLIDKTE